MIFDATVVFEANYNSKASIVVNQGGSWSTKTNSILKSLFVETATDPGSVSTVVAQDMPNMKVGVLRDFETIIQKSPQAQNLILDYNRTDKVFVLKNKSIIEFKSFKNAQDAKSGKRDRLFVNEANGIDYSVYLELALRTKKKTYIDYNPNYEFWPHEKLIGQPGVELIISDHRHNPFCPQEIRDKLEGLKDIDIELWKVYARGQTGKIEGLIYPNFTIIDSLPEDIESYCYGQDFGFNHPATLIYTGFKEDAIYWDEIIYQSGLITADIIQLMRDNNVQGDIFADAARPDTIEEIHQAGFNIYPADKSVKDGINCVKAKKLYITRRSVNTIKEIRSYKWKTDKNGKALDEPVKFLDDAMDAARYGTYNGLNKPTLDYSW
jgi:phage terminase large subunit